MPSPTRPDTLEPDSVSQSSKHPISDAESAPYSKKARIHSPTEPGTRPDSTRDTKRRRKKKKKVPIVTPGAAKNEPATDEHSRAPLSARNQVIRFTPAPPEAGLPASSIPVPEPSSLVSSSKSLGKRRQRASDTLDDSTKLESEAMPPTPSDKKQPVPAGTPVPESLASSLSDKVAQLEAELTSRDNLIASHQALLNQVQQAVTCQVCLDLMYKPYVLAPCGHLACHSCLVSWFTAPPSDNRPLPPPMMRRKTCPHCRGIVRERPVEVWGVKGIAHAMGKCGLLPNQLPVPTECLDADSDPWKDIFPKLGAISHRRLPWLPPALDVDDHDLNIAAIALRGEEVGMLDMEDGGIYRCLDCMHEIFGGLCSNCGRVYPGHTPGGDDEDDGDPMGWLEDQMSAEEVDVVDDPGWMGLEDGEADDSGDIVDRHRLSPWGRPFRMFRRSLGIFGAIHVEEDEASDDVDRRTDDLQFLEEDEESADEGYESSFIDDDEGGGMVDLLDGPRIYEIGDDDDDEPHRPAPPVDPLPDSEVGYEHEGSDIPERGRARRRYAVVVSSDEEVDEVSHSQRGRESDDS